MALKDIRKEIDILDRQLAEILEKRMELSLCVAEIKKKENIPVLNRQREEEVLKNITKSVSPEKRKGIENIYREIFRQSRYEQIRANYKYALLGEKLSYSYSKEIHESLGIYNYNLIELKEEEARNFLKQGDFQGINVTIPYKKTAFELCEKLSPIAKAIGSVNTVYRDESGKIIGTNTDYTGFISMVQKSQIDFKGAVVAVLGTGGAGVMVKKCAADLGAKRIFMVSRQGEFTYRDLEENREKIHVIVNTTPLGTYPDTDRSPINLQKYINCRGVLDLIYNPFRTKLILEAVDLGIPCCGGLRMLVRQAMDAANFFLKEEEDFSKRVEEIEKKILRDKVNPILIGMPGSGKSTLGKMLASALGRVFLDTDILIEEMVGMSVEKIFAEKGERFFREKEKQVIKEIALRETVVIATGGGAVMDEENGMLLRQRGRLFLLDRPLEKLAMKGRPLSKDTKALNDMYCKRIPVYNKIADYKIENSGELEEALVKIINIWRM